jgi:hypothetical protein
MMPSRTLTNQRDGYYFMSILQALRDLVPMRLRRRSSTIADFATLRSFLDMRCSFVAQSALYGYLRTRAGMRYPILFDDAGFENSVNIAKWHVWLACLSDLSVFTGGLLAQRTSARREEVGALMLATFDAILVATGVPAGDAILVATGVPAGAGAEFDAHAQRIRARLALCDWSAIPDDATPFTESEPALVYWAPIADELKQHDVTIVRNSIRFLWQEVRRALRRDLDAAALMRCTA